MDIVYGDCLALGGHRYALVIVNAATCYYWLYSMTSLTNSHIVIALQSSCADAGGIPRTFHSDVDKKLIGGDTLCWINKNNSRSIAANDG